MKRAALLLLAMAALLSLASCERIMKNMYDQPRDKAYSANPMFDDGSSSRLPPAGSIKQTQGALAGTSSGRRGAAAVRQAESDDAALVQPYELDEALLLRGKERYSIYCLPCHSPIGDGDGRIVRRGFPAPPSYHIPRLREAPDRHIYGVIRDGYGIMASYGDRVEPADRWAIIAFIRALQLSQYAKVSELPDPLAKEASAQLSRIQAKGSP